MIQTYTSLQSILKFLRNKFICVLIFLFPLFTFASEKAGWHIGDAKKEKSAPSAIGTYNVSAGPNTIYVAVLDSGVIAEHPSLSGSLVGGYDMISSNLNQRSSRSNNFAPDERTAKCGNKLVSSSFRTHGTEVASVIAGNGQSGMLGINPSAKIIPIRVFGVCGMSPNDLIDAMYWAAGIKTANLPVNPHPARIINISISGNKKECSANFQRAIDRMNEMNIFVVVAAGNNFNQPLDEPANCKGVISVGSVSADNRIEKHSALDSRTVIYAPGGGARIKQDVDWATNKIRVASYEPAVLGGEQAVVKESGIGTSYAAPIVAGLISLWLSYHPEKKPRDWFLEMNKFQRPVPNSETCSQCVPTSLVVDMKSMR